jgi:predicted enzyme related to lactoylglutathione lyase
MGQYGGVDRLARESRDHRALDWLTQVVVRLPDELAQAGDVWVSVNLRGQTSNEVLFNVAVGSLRLWGRISSPTGCNIRRQLWFPAKAQRRKGENRKQTEESFSQGESMSEQNNRKIGSISWADLTVENASELRDFYHEVVGWGTTGVDMGGYDDFCMIESQTNNAVAGICHARGLNASVPPVWLIYITVTDLDVSMARCKELGGEVDSRTEEHGARRPVLRSA